ncbi:MAG: protein-L-isoaspartate O-methyltransferase [Candidatus Uhrbacteria bacterium]|nr:protein-L-isoaspartate O-methyltransferase [Candidatus Uhrbacteria bacterium]
MSLFMFRVSIAFLFFIICVLVLVGYLLVQGSLSVPWVRTHGGMSRRMLELAGFKPGMRVLDLGSGDGSIVFQAVAMGGEGIGMERLRPLVLYSRLLSSRLGQGRATFRRGNILKDELPEADIVTAYLFPKVNRRLEPRLRERFPAGTRVVSRDFMFPTLRKLTSEHHGNSTLHVYEL